MPTNAEIVSLVREKTETLAKILSKQESENLLHGMFQLIQAAEQARFGSVTFHFVAGKLRNVETRETFQAQK